MMITRLSFSVIAVALLMSGAMGCQGTEAIEQYTVARIEPDRMLAALVERPDELWFFKITGPTEAVEPQVDTFRQFLSSVRFSPSGEPKWTLSEGWKQEAGSQLRYATIKIPGDDKPLELAVSKLARPDDDRDKEQFTLNNLNRWRNQLMLPAISAYQIPKKAELLSLEAGQGYLVSWAGTLRPARPGGAPFAAADAPPTERREAPRAKPAPSQQPVTYKLPEGWVETANDAVSQYAFKVTKADRTARITISQLGPASGSLAANVNRWREQLGLARLPEEEVPQGIKSIDVGDLKGSYAELAAPDDAEEQLSILGVIVSDKSSTWFIKLKGDSQLAQREKQRFEAFVQSLKLTGDGGPHGD